MCVCIYVVRDYMGKMHAHSNKRIGTSPWSVMTLRQAENSFGKFCDFDWIYESSGFSGFQAIQQIPSVPD